jgi:hypothetical protein
MLRRAGKLFLLALALVAGGLLALHTTARETVAGSGKSATQQRNLGDVTEVVLCGSGDLVLEAGDTPMLSVTADDNVLPVIVTKVDGKKLILRPRSHTTIHPQTPITYTLTLPRLKSITHSGTGTISAERLDADSLMVKLSGASNANLMNLTCKSLTLNLSGAGRARLTGVTDTLKLNQSGTTGIDARGLKATNAEVRVSGTSNATVWTEHELKARTSGKGEIQYKGHPSQISQRSSCSSRIHPIE